MLDDILNENTQLVIAGTAVGEASARRGLYYAGRGNSFWSTLKDVGLTPELLEPKNAADLLKLGIGLSDLVKNQSGNDNSIRFTADDVARFREKIEKLSPRIICFNGKKAAKTFLGVKKVEYGFVGEINEGKTKLFVAPSTSGAARRYFDKEIWQDLADLFRETQTEIGLAHKAGGYHFG